MSKQEFLLFNTLVLLSTAKKGRAWLRAWTMRVSCGAGFSFRRKLVIFLIFFVSLLGCDLFTKAWAERTLVRPISTTDSLIAGELPMLFAEEKQLYALSERVVIPHFWSFYYVRNYNVGFSLLRGVEAQLTKKTFRRLVIALQVLILSGIFLYFMLTQMTMFWPFVCIIGGGMANLVDRILNGYVVDFIKWYWEDAPIAILDPWPLFNLADVSISLGMCLFVWSVLIN